MLTRHYPYGEIEPFQRPHFGEPVPPSRYRPDIPLWLENVILKAIARDPAQRFETAEEFLLALERGASRPLPRRPRRRWRNAIRCRCGGRLRRYRVVVNLLLLFAGGALAWKHAYCYLTTLEFLHGLQRETVMTEQYILALDQGTTSSRAMVFDRAGNIVSWRKRNFGKSIRTPAGSSTTPRKSGRPRPASPPKRYARRPEQCVDRRDRHHQPARDHHRLGPRDRQAGLQRDRLAGSPHRRFLR